MALYKPAPPHNSLVAPGACLCVDCSRVVLGLRCPATDSEGHQCGNYRHRGDHTLLVATDFQIAAERIRHAEDSE